MPDFKELVLKDTHLLIHHCIDLLNVKLHFLRVSLLLLLLLDYLRLIKGFSDYIRELFLLIGIRSAGDLVVRFEALRSIAVQFDLPLLLFCHSWDKDAFDGSLFVDLVFDRLSVGHGRHILQVEYSTILAGEVVAHVALIELSFVKFHDRCHRR